MFSLGLALGFSVHQIQRQAARGKVRSRAASASCSFTTEKNGDVADSVDFTDKTRHHAEMAKKQNNSGRKDGSTRPAFASIFPGKPPGPSHGARRALRQDFVAAVEELEAQLDLPVWLLVQDGQEPRGREVYDSFNMLGGRVATAFFAARHTELVRGQKIALLIDSHGGRARETYELAMLLRRHCGGFLAVIPRRAKSAATLLSLGADEIIMNDHAELGPLDVQIFDPDREERVSGLDEVQALERLNAFAMQAFDNMMLMMADRTRKRVKTLMPVVSDFVTKLTQPMFQSIDVVRYTQMSRLVKVAEEYGKRLLQRSHGNEQAEKIASRLVANYPEHSFPIYADEAEEIGLNLAKPSDSLRDNLERITKHLPNLNAIGRIIKEGGKDHAKDTDTAEGEDSDEPTSADTTSS